MPRLQRKSFASPDQVRQFLDGRMDVVTLDEIAIGRFVFRPGWRWSKDVAPITGTRSCKHRHVGYTIAGSLHVRMDDGTSLLIGPNDAYEIPPGHDAWVVGDVPWDSVEFTSAHPFGLSPEELGERVLATILVSDIVGSTAILAQIGDQACEQAPGAQRPRPRGDRPLPRPRARHRRRRLRRRIRRRRARRSSRTAHRSRRRGAGPTTFPIVATVYLYKNQ